MVLPLFLIISRELRAMDNDIKFLVDTKFGKCVCTTSSWNHITNGHKIMAKNEAAIVDTLKEPLYVYKSDKWGNRDVYFAKSQKATYGEKFYTKVVVENNKEKPNEVITAWPQPDIKGGIEEGGLKHVDSKLGRKK